MDELLNGEIFTTLLEAKASLAKTAIFTFFIATPYVSAIILPWS